MAAPEVFVLSDLDGHSSVRSEDVAPEFEQAVHEAAGTCPEQAIIIFD
jgi:ferredoxin